MRNALLPSPSLPSSFFCSSTRRGVSPSSAVWIQLSEAVCNLLPFSSSLPFFFPLVFSFVVFLQETHWRLRHLKITSGLNSGCCCLTHGSTQSKMLSLIQVPVDRYKTSSLKSLWHPNKLSVTLLKFSRLFLDKHHLLPPLQQNLLTFFFCLFSRSTLGWYKWILLSKVS